MKDVMILTGAGQIGMAIARRMGYGMKIVIGDKKPENAQAIAEIMNNAGFDAVAMEMDLSSRDSIVTYSRRLRGGGFPLKHSNEYSINGLSPCAPRLCM